ncbi:MAG: hypothetical protein K0R71_1443 [Bacillales bacterium]|jgi:hypothetical protein|nr:hypothetical protein [Bacillales bacterium]
MNKKEYKKTVDQILPDDSLREKVWQGLGNKSSFFPKIKFSTLAFVSITILSVVSLNALLNSGIENKQFDQVKSSKMEKKVVSNEFKGFEEKVSKGNASADANLKGINDQENANKAYSSMDQAQGIFVPKFQLPAASSSKLGDSNKVLTLNSFVYNGKFYLPKNELYLEETMSNSAFEAIKGTYLGTTKEFRNRNFEESTDIREDGSNVENFSSNIQGNKIYTVKGYDPFYRLMVVGEGQNNNSYSMYECWNGINLSSGKDYFGNIYLENNVLYATWESTESFMGRLNQHHNLNIDQNFESFISSLYSTKPYLDSNQSDEDFKGSRNQIIIITLTMKNQVKEVFIISKAKKMIATENGFYFKMDGKEVERFFELLK